jgi:hypothetical protein
VYNFVEIPLPFLIQVIAEDIILCGRKIFQFPVVFLRILSDRKGRISFAYLNPVVGWDERQSMQDV